MEAAQVEAEDMKFLRHKKTAAHTLLFLPPSFGVFLVFTSSSHALAQQPVVPVLSRGTFLISGSDFLGSQTYDFKANCQNKTNHSTMNIQFISFEANYFFEDIHF